MLLLLLVHDVFHFVGVGVPDYLAYVFEEEFWLFFDSLDETLGDVKFEVKGNEFHEYAKNSFHKPIFFLKLMGKNDLCLVFVVLFEKFRVQLLESSYFDFLVFILHFLYAEFVFSEIEIPKQEDLHQTKRGFKGRPLQYIQSEIILK